MNDIFGNTVYMAQDALVDALKKLFDGKTYSGQNGRKPLGIYKQNLPIPADSNNDQNADDDDVDTEAAAAPFIVVKVAGSSVSSPSQPQTAEIMLTICCYDTGTDRQGSLDVINIQEDIKQRFCSSPRFGGPFCVLMPLVFALQVDDTYPYYFGNAVFDITAPAMTQENDKEIEALI